MSLEIVILAAGQGTRMRSALPKVLHPIAGKPMLGHVIDCARQLQPERIHVVIGHGADLVRERMAADDLNFVLQAEQLGTGHAVAQALPFLSADQVLILYGDVPLIQLDTLQRLLAQVTPDQLSLLTVDMLDPTGYGRIVRDDQGRGAGHRRAQGRDPAQRQIGEINTGILAVPGKRCRLARPPVQRQRPGRVLPDRRDRHGGRRRPGGSQRPTAGRDGSAGR